MARYIDAELLLTDNTYEWFDDWGNYTSAGQAIIDAPTADVAEVVHERWLSAYEYALKIGVTDEERLEEVKKDKWWKFCNNCEQQVKGERNYCPNCGAKMHGKKVE